MNIEISNEMIEQMVQKEVAVYVKRWFAENDHKYTIRDYVNQAVKNELSSFNYARIANDCAKEKVTKEMMKMVCNSISDNIASAYVEKYGGY